jgi:hypothetical protein
VCSQCGKEKQQPNKDQCDVCLEKDVVIHRQRRAERKQNGQCQRGSCKNFVEKNGEYFCKKCRELHKLRRFTLRGIKITKEQYDKMVEEQRGLCAITGQAPADGSILNIDHDHATGTVRQLLDRNINKALGLFQDNPEWLRKAADYLEFHANRE